MRARRAGLTTAAVLVLTAMSSVSCGTGSDSAPHSTRSASPSTTARAPTPPPPTERTRPPAPSGPFEVAVLTEELVDRSRSRALPTWVFYPARGGAPLLEAGPFPVFVWAHGFDASVKYFEPLLRAWASRGYVVVAPEFPGTKHSAVGGPKSDEYVHQPADVSFVLDRVVERFGPTGSVHAGLADSDHVAVGGHSLGAITTRGLVADRCCVDERVDAAVEISPGDRNFPGGAPYERGVPLLVIHASADTTFPLAEGRRVYSAATGAKYFVVLEGRPHTPFRDERARAVIVESVLAFLDATLKGLPGASERLRAAGSTAGVARFEDVAAP